MNDNKMTEGKAAKLLQPLVNHEHGGSHTEDKPTHHITFRAAAMALHALQIPPAKVGSIS